MSLPGVAPRDRVTATVSVAATLSETQESVQGEELFSGRVSCVTNHMSHPYLDDKAVRPIGSGMVGCRV